nr:DDE-type integrase/transposase/recombinase [Mesorhizobium intechi]
MSFRRWLSATHYGYRRIAALLRREGWQVNHKWILGIMREDNLLCLRARPFVPVTTNSRHGWHVVPNLAKGMILNGLDQLWVADITFLHLAEEFAFLAVVLDAFSRKVVGWALDTHLRESLATEALEMAIANRQPEPGSLVHHSDRGVQGGFKRSSQHSEVGGCDEHSKAAIGTVWTSAIAFTRTAACGGAR